MNAYWYLLLWQALLARSAFWIRPSGWLWCLIIALVIIVLESIISCMRNRKGCRRLPRLSRAGNTPKMSGCS